LGFRLLTQPTQNRRHRHTAGKALGLTAGTRLELEVAESGSFVSREAAKQSHFAKFRGMAKRKTFLESKAAMDALRGKVEKCDID